MSTETVETADENRRFRGTLRDLDTGVVARIVALDVEPAELRRLRSLGIRTGSDVQVSQHRGAGVVLAAAGGRIALGADVARRILVEAGAR